MTKRLVALALLFALAACPPLLVADAIWGVDVSTLPLARRISNLHWLFHLGTITLTTAGAYIGLQVLDGPAPWWIVAVLGFAFGLVSIAAVPVALVFDDAYGIAWWQFLGAGFVAVGASPFAKKPDAAAAKPPR